MSITQTRVRGAGNKPLLTPTQTRDRVATRVALESECRAMIFYRHIHSPISTDNRWMYWSHEDSEFHMYVFYNYFGVTAFRPSGELLQILRVSLHFHVPICRRLSPTCMVDVISTRNFWTSEGFGSFVWPRHSACFIQGVVGLLVRSGLWILHWEAKWSCDGVVVAVSFTGKDTALEFVCIFLDWWGAWDVCWLWIEHLRYRFMYAYDACWFINWGWLFLSSALGMSFSWRRWRRKWHPWQQPKTRMWG